DRDAAAGDAADHQANNSTREEVTTDERGFTQMLRTFALVLSLGLSGALVLAAPSTQPTTKPTTRPAGIMISPVVHPAPVDFQKEVLPILASNCLACHNKTKAKAGLVLETPADMLKGGDTGPAIVPKKGGESL